MGWIGETMDSIKSLQIRQVLTQAVSLGSFFFSSLSFFRFNFSFNLPSIVFAYTPKQFQFSLLRSNSSLPAVFRVFIINSGCQFFHCQRLQEHYASMDIFAFSFRGLSLAALTPTLTLTVTLVIDEDQYDLW